MRSASWCSAAWLAWVALCLAGVVIVPPLACGRDAGALFDGDQDTQDALAREVIAYVSRDEHASFHTGSDLFDGEWAVATYQMSILALGQIVLEHPELRDDYLPAMRHAADRMVARDTLRFGRTMWGTDPLAGLPAGEGHAYLGYVNLALGMLRLVDPETPHAALHDRLTEALARRLDRSPHGIFETYPGQAFPPDVASVAGSIGLHQRATGVDRSALLARWSARYRAAWVDGSGYLVQLGDPRTGEALDAPRGSGTAIAAYFVSFCDRALSRDLDRALARHGHATFLGFGAVREYGPGHDGWGDIDSGPVVLGVGVSPTGFALAGARLHGDRDRYVEIVRTATLFGVPVEREGGRRFLAGGPIGNAILLAMLTATPLAMPAALPPQEGA